MPSFTLLGPGPKGFHATGTWLHFFKSFFLWIFSNTYQVEGAAAVVVLYKGTCALIGVLIWIVLLIANSVLLLFGDLLHNLADAAKAKNCTFLPHIFKGEVGFFVLFQENSLTGFVILSFIC